MVAVAAHVLVAAAKLAAGLITGSSALLAETVHSAADSINESPLYLAIRRGRRPADARHPLGFGAARFLWAFLAAISSFLLGGCVSIGLAIHSLLAGSAVDHFSVAWVVLAIAALADGASLAQTLRQARIEASVWGGSTVSYLRHTSEPTLRALAVEDAAAPLGVTIAERDSWCTSSGAPARPTPSLLYSSACCSRPPPSASRPARRLPDRAVDVTGATRDGPQNHRGTPSTQHRTEVILMAKVHPAAGTSGDQLAQLLDQLDQRLRRELPEIGEVFIDVTAHLARTEPRPV